MITRREEFNELRDSTTARIIHMDNAVENTRQKIIKEKGSILRKQMIQQRRKVKKIFRTRPREPTVQSVVDDQNT